MDSRRNDEIVAVGAIAVGFVEVERIASDDHFGDLGSCSRDLVGVSLCFAAVEVWRIHDVYDVV